MDVGAAMGGGMVVGWWTAGKKKGRLLGLLWLEQWLVVEEGKVVEGLAGEKGRRRWTAEHSPFLF